MYIKTTYGVLQGSILGPILLLLYVNDLPGYVQNAKLVLHAENTSILVADRQKVLELKIS
jgi:hypothetical protein